MDAPITPAGRIAAIDAARGIAIVAMASYHATWDLGPAFYGLIPVDAGYDPTLRVAARIIAGSFLLLVGIGLVLAHHRGFRPRPFLRRLAFIVLGAAVITLVTWLARPYDYVGFGILHLIAVTSVLALPFVWVPPWITAPIATIVVLSPTWLAGPTFDQPIWYWLGLGTYSKPAVDYTPVLPWLGIVLAGIVLGRLILLTNPAARWRTWRPKAWAGRALVWMGRWSLPIYIIHQPLVLALLYPVALIAGGNTALSF